jgi:hypothetical protein
MVRHAATDEQAGSQSNEGRSRSMSEDPAPPSGGKHPLSRQTPGPSRHPALEQWPALLDDFKVDFLMVDAERDSELLTLFQAHPGWAIDSQDDQSVLLVRVDVGLSAVSPTSVR